MEQNKTSSLIKKAEQGQKVNHFKSGQAFNHNLKVLLSLNN